MGAQPEAKRTARVPPHSDESEWTVLGCCLLADEAVEAALEYLDPEGDAFYGEANRRVWVALREMWEGKLPLNLSTLAQELEERGQLEGVGGRPFLASLLDYGFTSDPSFVSFHARVLERKWVRRRIIRAGSEAVSAAFEEDEAERTTEELAGESAAAMEEASSFGSVRGSVARNRDLMAPAMARYKALASGDKPPRILTGLTAFDKATGGLFLGDYVVVASPTSVGKSALGLQVALAAAGVKLPFCPLPSYWQQEHPTVYFSVEMRSEVLRDRQISVVGSVPSRRLRMPEYLTEEQWGIVEHVSETLAAAPLSVVSADTVGNGGKRQRSLSLSTILLLAGKEIRRGARVVVVDYLQIVESDRSAETREREVALMSKALLNLAHSTGTLVIAMAQVSQDYKLRRNKEPEMTDLRESQAPMHDADVSLMLYRPSYFDKSDLERDPEEPCVEPAYIYQMKGRNGGRAKARVGWQGAYTRFLPSVGDYAIEGVEDA